MVLQSLYFHNHLYLMVLVSPDHNLVVYELLRLEKHQTNRQWYTFEKVQS
jgi:hypothetical protein